MSVNSDWLEGSRELQLGRANDWLLVLDFAKIAAWNIPQTEVTELQTLRSKAEEIFKVLETVYRTTEDTEKCNIAFTKLVAQMRKMKNHYFLVPPLETSDLIALKLKPHSTTKTDIKPPVDMVIGRVVIRGEHLLELHMEPATNTTDDPHRSDYGFRIYWGILTPPGTPSEKLRQGKREISEVPVSGEDLPHSRFTRRKKELFDFPQEDRGKTVYFCIRYENAKGQPGPWGPIFSAIIP
ncbi:MAG: hypothetical protein LBK06_01240 [Planctomycetaceae bacterium]|jgi:hypothetical protein|nr:hypothetical protein [Planctomycetaceae bacterium]